MYLTPAPMAALTVGGVCYYASLWTITRADGVILRVTDHDSSITRAGVEYTMGGSFEPTAREKKEGVDPGNLDIRGVFELDAITTEDLMAGVYRDARIVEEVIDWRFPDKGIYRRDEYRFNEVTFTGEMWVAQLDTFLIVLKPKKGRRYLRTCQWELGDADCQADVSTLTVTGTVTAIVENNRVFESSVAGAVGDGFYADGHLTWTSGANNGLKVEVLDSLETDGVFFLVMPTERLVEVGDTFSVHPGCNHIMEDDAEANIEGHCTTRWNNVPRFGGFPFMRGTDSLLETPESTT